MNNDAVSLGALIRARREEKKLSLKEVENSTSIRSHYLQAIEEGRVCELISGVYGLGFMRQYIQFLGLSLEEFLEQYPGAFRVPKESHDFTYGLGTLEPRTSSHERSKWLPNAVWVLVSGAVLTVAYFVAKHVGVI